MNQAPSTRRVAAPRLTALTGLTLAVGVLVQGLLAGGFLQGERSWLGGHEVLGTLLVLPPLVSLVAALGLRRREPDSPAVLITRVFLLVLVVTVLVSGHAGRSMLAVHVPAAVAVAGIAVRQAAGFVRVPGLPPSRRPAGAGH